MTVKKITSPDKFIGLSTDTKPHARTGSTFYETDTGAMYMYDEGAWLEKDVNQRLAWSLLLGTGGVNSERYLVFNWLLSQRVNKNIGEK